jgi:hypothetical protein
MIYKKIPHSQEGRLWGKGFYFQEVLKKIISGLPATASLRWLLIYPATQENQTWTFVKY